MVSTVGLVRYNADGNPLPGWLTFDAVARSFSGTPIAAEAGAIDVQVTATAPGGLAANDVFTLNIVDNGGWVI